MMKQQEYTVEGELETARGHVMTFISIPRDIDESSTRKIPPAFEWKTNYDCWF